MAREFRVQVLLNAEEFIGLEMLTENGESVSHSAYFRSALRRDLQKAASEKQSQREKEQKE